MNNKLLTAILIMITTSFVGGAVVTMATHHEFNQADGIGDTESNTVQSISNGLDEEESQDDVNQMEDQGEKAVIAHAESKRPKTSLLQEDESSKAYSANFAQHGAALHSIHSQAN